MALFFSTFSVQLLLLELELCCAFCGYSIWCHIYLFIVHMYNPGTENRISGNESSTFWNASFSSINQSVCFMLPYFLSTFKAYLLIFIVSLEM